MANIQLPNNKAASELTREELEEVVIKQAWRDESFRDELKRSPKQAIEKLLSVKIPDGLKINVVQDVQDQITLVLPQFPAAIGELRESQLQAVAGGVSGLQAPGGAVSLTFGCVNTEQCTIVCSWGSRYGMVANPATLAAGISTNIAGKTGG